MKDKLLKEFTESFGQGQEARLFFAPSRINIIGEHIDYNGGRVLPCAIEIGTYGLARPNDEGILRLKSLNIDHEGQISLDDLNYREEDSWMNYVKGMTKFIKEDGYNVAGFDLLVYGNIPNGSGLSSSASLELLVGQVISSLFNQGEIDPIRLAQLGQKTENDFIGVNSGIMDQFAIALGKKDHAMLLDTKTLEYEYIPFDLGDYRIVIMNTNKRRELKDSKYNERREESEKALEEMKKALPNIECLCDIEERDEALLQGIDDLVIRKRARHVVEENLRVKEAVEALKAGDIEKLGQLLIQSNESLRELYEVTGLHLDSITRHANRFVGCLGARMTGAGFGGCAIAIVKKDLVDMFKVHVGRGYKEDTDLDAGFITSSVGDGVREIVE